MRPKAFILLGALTGEHHTGRDYEKVQSVDMNDIQVIGVSSALLSGVSVGVVLNMCGGCTI